MGREIRPNVDQSPIASCSFARRLKQAIAENERRKQQEAEAEQRRKAREESIVKRRTSSQGNGKALLHREQFCYRD